jgi:hypothetical protein
MRRSGLALALMASTSCGSEPPTGPGIDAPGFSIDVTVDGGDPIEASGDSTYWRVSTLGLDLGLRGPGVGAELARHVYLSFHGIPALFPEAPVPLGTYDLGLGVDSDMFLLLDTGPWWATDAGGALVITRSDASMIGGHFEITLDRWDHDPLNREAPIGTVTVSGQFLARKATDEN